MNRKVLMIGPGFENVGGIKALCELVVPELKDRVDLLYFWTVNKRPPSESGRFNLRNMLLTLSQYGRFLYSTAMFNPSIIHLHTSQGLGWLKDIFYVVTGKLFRCHVIIHVHACSYDEFYQKNSGLYRYITRKVFGLADAIVSVSGNWRDVLSGIISKDRIHVLTNCMAVDHAAQFSKKNGPPVILFIGTVGPRKGAYDLIKAMSALHSQGLSFELLIAGGEEYKGGMERAIGLIKKYHLEDCCTLLGEVDLTSKNELLKRANLFVLPSYNEGLPMAVLEAMAAGLSIITTPVGGIPEVIEDGYNGFLVAPGDRRSLSDKLFLLLRDVKLRNTMGRRNYEIIKQKLDVQLYVKKLLMLYQVLVSK